MSPRSFCPHWRSSFTWRLSYPSFDIPPPAPHTASSGTLSKWPGGKAWPGRARRESPTARLRARIDQERADLGVTRRQTVTTLLSDMKRLR